MQRRNCWNLFQGRYIRLYMFDFDLLHKTLFSMQDSDYRIFQCRLMPGVPEETVQAQIQSAQQAVLGQMKRYAQQGVTFTQANSLPALLRTRMLLNPAPEKAHRPRSCVKS